MKATLEFVAPDDNYAYRCALMADAAFRALSEINEHLRSRLKYATDMTDETRQELEELRDMIPHQTIQWVNE